MSQSTIPTEILPVMDDLRRYAMTLTRDLAMRDDLVQETVLRAMERQDLLRDPEGLRAWLFQLMRNRLIDLRRSDMRRTNREEALQWIQTDHAPARQDMQVRLSQVREAFATLPDDQRRALQMVAIDGISCRDAASIEGIALGTLLSRVARARQKLRDLEEEPASEGFALFGRKKRKGRRS